MTMTGNEDFDVDGDAGNDDYGDDDIDNDDDAAMEWVSIEEGRMDDGVGTRSPTPGTYHLLQFSSHH